MKTNENKKKMMVRSEYNIIRKKINSSKNGSGKSILNFKLNVVKMKIFLCQYFSMSKNKIKIMEGWIV